jgi:hypothetical protein
MSVEHSRVPISGIYPDGWVGTAADIGLCLPESAASLHVEGMLPSLSGIQFPYIINVGLNGASVGKVSLARPGEFRVSLPLNGTTRGIETGQRVNVELRPMHGFTPPGGDTRRLSFRLHTLALTHSES